MEISFKAKIGNLVKNLENVPKLVTEQIKMDIKNLAHQSLNRIITSSQKKLNSTLKTYQSGLKIEENDQLGEYLIYLDGEMPNKLESGWGAFDQKEKMLRSTSTVTEGPRAGMPWVRVSKKGHRFARVPFNRSLSKHAKNADVAQAVQSMKAININNRMQKITNVFKDPEGLAYSGKVAVAKVKSASIAMSNVLKSRLENLTKYQYVNKKGQVERSIYRNYRTISANPESKAKWRNPGFKGVGAFKEVYKWADRQMSNLAEKYKKHFG